MAVKTLISPEKAGERVGVTGKTVRKWILAGRLDGSWIKTPTGRYQVDLDAVLDRCGGDRAVAYIPPREDVR